jgi:LCP family protein required for cell wall assembly
VTRSVRLSLIIGSAVLVVVVSVLVGWRVLTNRMDHAIPRADLFGASASASAPGTPTPSPTPPAGADIKGPLTFLIAGVDTRVSVPGWVPRSDAVMILHVSADLRHAYLTSLPRDLLVDVPAFAPSHFGGEHTKLTHAMAFGAIVPGSNQPDPAQGFQLLAKTVSAYTGIKHFDAGIVFTFNGLIKLVESIGGVDLYVDELVTSIHMRPDGDFRTPCASCPHGYSGPQMTYTVGTHHLFGWQALDYARQRYLPGSDYDRQRHQRQLIKAIIGQLFDTDVIGNPGRILSITHALGNAIVFDGRGRSVVEFAYALRDIRPAALTLIGLPGSGVYSGGQYLGEALDSVEAAYFTALRQDTLDGFVTAHPDLVNADKPA